MNETVEQRIVELQDNKRMLAEGALGDVKNMNRLGLQDFRFLFRAIESLVNTVNA